MLPALAIMAFLAPGAWHLTYLPAQPEAATSQLVVVGLWLVAIGAGALRVVSLDRRLVWALVGVGVSVAVSTISAGHILQALLYDVFGAMPLVQWLAFPVVFAIASIVAHDKSVVRAASLVTAFAVLMSLIQLFQWVRMDGYATVFGSTGYSITALAPLIPVAVALALTQQGYARGAWFAAAGALMIALSSLSGAAMGVLASGFAVLLSTAVASRQGVLGKRQSRHFGRAALVLAAAVVLVLLVVQIPAVSGSFVSPDFAGGGDSVSSRVQIWQGAEALFAEHPLLGVGPAGYRIHAVEYLSPEALSYGADLPGNIDPTVYSPQSPHALLWEVGTRLGVVGWLAFGALFAVWIALLRERLHDGDGSATLRAGLAAAFLTALFALMVQPVHFAHGLFAPVAAGLAIAPGGVFAGTQARASRGWHRFALVCSGVLLVAVSAWLLYGQWVAESVSPEDLVAAIEAHEKALEIIPGHPNLERRLLAFRIIAAADEGALQDAQRAVDLAPGYINGFAPAMVNFAGHSLAQADRTGRTDVAWERRVLDEAERVLPPIPSLAAERLHVAIIEGDRAAVDAAIPDAQRWGETYPYTGIYLQRAGEVPR